MQLPSSRGQISAATEGFPADVILSFEESNCKEKKKIEE